MIVKVPKNKRKIPKAFDKFSKPTNFTRIIDLIDPCSAEKEGDFSNKLIKIVDSRKLK